MKNKLLIIISVIFVFLIISFSLVFSKISASNKKIEMYKSNIQAMNDSLKTFKAKNGVLVTEKQSYYSSLKELESINKNLYDTIKGYEKALKIKTNTIQVVTVDGKVITHYDTVKEYIVKSSDSVVQISLKTSKKDSVVTSEITADIQMKSKDSLQVLKSNLNSTFEVNNLKLNVITGYKKQGFFKPSKEYVSAVTTNDNRFKISKIDSWINRDFEKKRYLSLKPGIFAGGFYDPFYKHFSLGIGFGLTLQYIK